MTTTTYRRSYLPRDACLAMLAGCLAAGLAATHATPPSVQPLLQSKWTAGPAGSSAWDVKVAGHYAYIAFAPGGLAVVDMSNPTNYVQVGGYDTNGTAWGVAVSGNYAYLRAIRVSPGYCKVSSLRPSARSEGFVRMDYNMKGSALS